MAPFLHLFTGNPTSNHDRIKPEGGGFAGGGSLTMTSCEMTNLIKQGSSSAVNNVTSSVLENDISAPTNPTSMVSTTIAHILPIMFQKSILVLGFAAFLIKLILFNFQNHYYATPPHHQEPPPLNGAPYSNNHENLIFDDPSSSTFYQSANIHVDKAACKYHQYELYRTFDLNELSGPQMFLG